MNGHKIRQLRELVRQATADPTKVPKLNKQGWRRLKDEYGRRPHMTVGEVRQFIRSLTHEDLRKLMRGMTEEQQEQFITSIMSKEKAACSS